VAFRPRRIYAFGFAKHRSLPLAALRVRMTSHECNEFVGTTPTIPRIVISSGSEKSAFDQELENSRFLVAPAPRNDKGVRCLGRLQQPQSLSCRAKARDLLLTKSWRTADSSSLRLLGMTRSKVSSPASTNPKPLSFQAKREICFRAKIEEQQIPRRLGLLGMTRRRFEVGSRGSNPSFLKKKKGCRLSLHP